MATHDQVWRFAAGGPDVPRSAVYRVWAPKPESGKGDVYISLRRMGEEFKMSLHALRGSMSARGHIAVSRDTQRQVGLDERFLQTWERPPRAPDSPPDFQLFLLGSELRTEADIEDDFTNVSWLAPPPVEGGLVVSVIITSGEKPGREMTIDGRFQVLAQFDLGDGSTCRVTSQVVPELPADFRSMIERAKDRMRSAPMDFAIGAPSIDDPLLRAIIGAEKYAGGQVSVWIEVNLAH